MARGVSQAARDAVDHSDDGDDDGHTRTETHRQLTGLFARAGWADCSHQVVGDRPHLSACTIETDCLCRDRVKAWIDHTPATIARTMR